jgi:signal transduction histidine kinase
VRTLALPRFLESSITGEKIPGRSAPLAESVWQALVLVVAGIAFPDLPTGTRALLPLLIALAGVVLAGLTIRRAPSVAWLATIGASYAASTLVFARATALVPGQADLWRWVLVVGAASLWAFLTLRIAARYATRPAGRIEPIAIPVAAILVTWLVVACLTTILVVLAGQRTPDPAFNWIDIATAPTSFFLPLLLAVTALGIVADLRAARDRARLRLTTSPGSTRAEDIWQLGAATLRELVPGQFAAEEATLAAERTRLAGDLHATVLPGLRRAIAEAEAGGDPDVLARQLRTVDVELERLMADRWPVVLEAFGLVAALEDLAERIETDAGLAVQIDVERAGERPPPSIERTAWRVAQLAIDNATRHADASNIMVTVAVAPEGVTLGISDDGRGFDPTASGAVRVGARGLADATRRALAVGATIRIEPRAGGGTTVTFDWVAKRA